MWGQGKYSEIQEALEGIMDTTAITETMEIVDLDSTGGATLTKTIGTWAVLLMSIINKDGTLRYMIRC
jgi:hypothetical protein